MKIYYIDASHVSWRQIHSIVDEKGKLLFSVEKTNSNGALRQNLAEIKTVKYLIENYLMVYDKEALKQEIEVRTDSEDVCNWMKSPLNEIVDDKARKQVEKILELININSINIKFKWIDRKDNERADFFTDHNEIVKYKIVWQNKNGTEHFVFRNGEISDGQVEALEKEINKINSEINSIANEYNLTPEEIRQIGARVSILLKDKSIKQNTIKNIKGK